MAKKIQIKKLKSNALGWVVFFATLEIVLVSLIPVIFPALIARTVSPVTISPVSPWEIGAMAGPLILTNLIVLGIGLAYYFKKLPQTITNSIKFIFNFEVSKKIAFLSLSTMLAIYVGFSINELAAEEEFGDYDRVKNRVLKWNIDQIGNTEPHFRYMLLYSSLTFLDNIRIIPFIASIALVIVTYFLTKELAGKRFSGLVATAILLTSPVFLRYDTTATYENFWILLYIFSLYLLYKFWPLSAVPFILSIASKPLTVLFLPMTLFFIYRLDSSNRKKILAAMPYIVLLIAGVIGVGIFSLRLVGGAAGEITFVDRFFWNGFSSMSFQLRYDLLTVLFLLPLVVGLFILSRKGLLQAESVMVLIAGLLFSAPLLTGFTDITNQPYRFVPLVLFFAMGVGVILSKRNTAIKKT